MFLKLRFQVPRGAGGKMGTVNVLAHQKEYSGHLGHSPTAGLGGLPNLLCLL